MRKLIIIGKFKKNTNKCAEFTVPFEESKNINFNEAYVIVIEGPIIHQKSAYNKTRVIL